MPKYSFTRDGKTITLESQRDLSREELETISAKSFGAQAAAQKPDMSRHPWMQVNEAAKKGQLPSGEPIGAKLKHGAKVATGLERPDDFDDSVLAAAGTLPLIAAGGAGAARLAAGAPAAIRAMAPAAGRVATAGAMGAAKGEGVEDTALAVGSELLPFAGRVATHTKIPFVKGMGKVAGPAEAIDAIRRRIGKGPDGAVNLEGFERWFRRWRSAGSEADRAMEAKQMSDFLRGTGRFEGRGLGDAEAADIFDTFVRGSRVSPEMSQAAVKATHPGNVAQSGLDALISQTPFGEGLAGLAMSLMDRGGGARRFGGTLEGSSR